MIYYYEYWRVATRHCCAHKLIDFAKRTSTNCLHKHIALLTQSDVAWTQTGNEAFSVEHGEDFVFICVDI